MAPRWLAIFSRKTLRQIVRSGRTKATTSLPDKGQQAMQKLKANSQTTWTPDREDLLRKLWALGLSASQCAERIGEITRSSVIGKAHRLGLARRGPSWIVTSMRKRANSIEPAAREAGKKAAQEIERKKADFRVEDATDRAAVAAPVVSLAESKNAPASLHIPLLDLQAGMCRWPEDDYRQGFCGHKTVPGTSWCPRHHFRAFDQKRRPR